MHRTDYKICPYCGAALDVGERCDCAGETGRIYHLQTGKHTLSPKEPEAQIDGKISA